MTRDGIEGLIRKHGLISDQVNAGELAVILTELSTALAKNDGSIVEFGCYRGTTSLYVRRILDALNDDRAFHVYDSFAGLPEKSDQDSSPAGLQFVAGELSVSKKDFINEFTRAHLKVPVIHKGWFNELEPDDIPKNIAFAFLDGDYYESVKAPLRLIQDRMMPGATLVVDDYANEALPGAAKALDEWLQGRDDALRVIRSLAVVHLR